MKYRRLGSSALQVSELCLGTMNFGPRTSEPDAFDILDRSFDCGVNFVDTANQYGGDLGVGTTETILGNWLKNNKAKRDKIVLATKVYEPMSDDINDRGLSARHIQQACDASLQRLGVDHIDLYQMHHLDRAARPEEIWQAMDRLIAQGKITYVGTSNFPGWSIAQLNEKAHARGGMGTVSEQHLYNLLERRAELEVLPACQAYGVGMIVWSPLAGGLLAGAPSDDQGRRGQARQNLSPRLADRLAQFETFCADQNEAPGVVALSWLLHRRGIASVIIGPAAVDQFDTALKAVNLGLGDDALNRLDEIFAPVGPAPEAYAW